MKSFLSLFTDSAKSLKNLRTITTTGMLIALAVAIHSLSIQVTIDLRIGFTFIPIAIIAMLYGPVVCGMSTFLIDLIGFLLDNKTPRGYSIQLGLALVIAGILYGIILYKADIKYDWKNILRIAVARFSVILIVNIVLNSYFLYTLYINKDFSIIKSFSDGEMSGAFLTWLSPRVIKNLVEFPIDVVLLSAVLPASNIAYKSVMKSYNRA